MSSSTSRLAGRRSRHVISIRRLQLLLAVSHDRLDLGLGDERALQSDRLARSHRQEQRVAKTDQLLGTRLVEDDPTVSQAGGRERQPRWHVRLDQAGHDVDARTLRRQHKVNTGRARELGDPHDRVFDVARRDHHQVGELVDDDKQVRVRPIDPLAAGRRHERAGVDRSVEVVDVPIARRREVVVAHVHLAHDPLQRLGSLLRVGDDRRDQVRNAFVAGQLDPLGVDQHEAHLVGCGTGQDRGDDRVDAGRLA